MNTPTTEPAPQTELPEDALPEKGVLFFIRASTGCTCCEDQNFIQGPYLTEKAAKEDISYHQRQKTLSSQYAPNGQYSILTLEYERAGDWLIIDKERALPIDSLELPERLNCFEEHYML